MVRPRSLEVEPQEDEKAESRDARADQERDRTVGQDDPVFAGGNDVTSTSALGLPVTDATIEPRWEDLAEERRSPIADASAGRVAGARRLGRVAARKEERDFDKLHKEIFAIALTGRIML